MTDIVAVGTTTVDVPEDQPSLSPEQLAAVTALGVALIENSADLTQAVAAITPTDASKAPLEIVDLAVQAGQTALETI